MLKQLLLTAAVTLALTPAAFADGFLHAQGQSIVDDAGHPVLLRGVGLGNWTLPEGYMWHFGKLGDRPRRIEKIVSDLLGPDQAEQFWRAYRDNYITEADIHRIAQLGFNAVRPSLNARLFLTEGDNPRYRDEGFRIVDNLVKWCRANHVYLIIDMHAAPGGQTGQNIDDSANDIPELFANPENKDRLVALWLKIADRYKDEPTVAAYDLLNEPLPHKTGAEEKYKSQLEPLYKRITAAIRTVDPKHMITLEGADWANDWSVFTTRFDPNLLYQFHYYCWDNPTNLKSINQYLEARDRLDAPVWVGETGERDATIYWATTDLFESHNIGWSFWPWKKMDSRNGLYTFKQPAGWAKIIACSQDENAPKPSPEEAQKIFDELLHNIRLENCTFSEEDTNALFHRLPARVEAENYGHRGPGESYFVHTSANSPLYRKAEPVPVVPIASAPSADTDRRRRHNDGQAIRLTKGEWTAYDLNTIESRDYPITLRVKPTTLPASVTLTLNNTTQQIPLTTEGWTTLTLPPIPLPAGVTHMKLSVDTGTADIDWIQFQ